MVDSNTIHIDAFDNVSIRNILNFREVEPDRISKELAFLLKSKGFNKDCEYYWKLSSNIPYSDGKYRNYNEDDNTANAYLLTEAYRWIRKITGFDVVITQSARDVYACNIYYFKEGGKSSTRLMSLSKDSYEDAFDAGLINSLKISKNQGESIIKILEIIPDSWKDDFQSDSIDSIIDSLYKHGYDLLIKEYFSHCEWSLIVTLENNDYSCQYHSLKKNFESRDEAFLDAIQFINRYNIIKKKG